MAGPNDTSLISLDNLVQNLNQIVQYLGRLTNDLEGGKAQLWQPYNSLLVSIAALSATLTTGNLIQGSGVGTVAALLEGASGTFLKSQGTGSLLTWANAIVGVKLQVFTATGAGIYTPSTGTVMSLLGAGGSGAGGGGCAASTAGNEGSGGGGGGGGFSLALKTAAQIGASQVLNVGAGVAGGTAGNNAGTVGNDTSIGGLCVGKGGTGGGGAAANAAGASGAGGVAGTGDITIPGEAGGIGNAGSIITLHNFSGQGGASGFGLGYGGVSAYLATGNNGQNYGGGGSGGSDANAAGAKAGGTGAQGIAFALDFTNV